MIGQTQYIKPEQGMEVLRKIFPKGEANSMNICLFSTSGVHGTYTTIEEVEIDSEEHGNEVTFLIIKPRAIQMLYGNVIVESQDDINYLKALRESSKRAMAEIGNHD